MVTNYPLKGAPGIIKGTTGIITKGCEKRVGHGIVFSASAQDDEVYIIQISLGQSIATFSLYVKKLWIDPGYMILPYFDPDLSDYEKLVNKIKTYILFA